MPWVKLDDGFAEHPKIEAVGPVAAHLHVAALCYCARQLTDGFVPEDKARRLVSVRGIGRHIDALVSASVWLRVANGYQIHDYLDFQPSRSEVEADRKAAKERMAKMRGSRRANAQNLKAV